MDKDISETNASSFLSSATQINEKNFGPGTDVTMQHSHSDPKLCGRSVGPYPPREAAAVVRTHLKNRT